MHARLTQVHLEWRDEDYYWGKGGDQEKVEEDSKAECKDSRVVVRGGGD
jgi:hypothetical protein